MEKKGKSKSKKKDRMLRREKAPAMMEEEPKTNERLTSPKKGYYK